jgi:hypothetical protein
MCLLVYADYNYEAIFYGIMAANHPSLMASYPNPMLDYIPKAEAYAAAKAQHVLNITCPGLHYPDVLAPWGFEESGDGINKDAGLDSNGPCKLLVCELFVCSSSSFLPFFLNSIDANMPIIWAWEYGDRKNKTEIMEKWWPLVKGEVDFFTCYLQKNATDDGYLHVLHDCTNESPGICAGMDTTLTLSLMKRSFDVASDMARFLGEPVDPKWAEVQAKTTPLALGYMHVEVRTRIYARGGSTSNSTSATLPWPPCNISL